MSLLRAVLGDAKEIDATALEKEFAALLIEGEDIHHAYKLYRELIVFTNHRLILVDKQGITGKKKEYLSIPYKSIDYFSKETAGRFDLDAEIKFWVKGRNSPIKLEFRKDKSVHELFRLLSHYVLNQNQKS